LSHSLSSPSFFFSSLSNHQTDEKQTHIQHESLTLQEEKKVVEELNKLRVARKSVAAAAAKASAAAAGAAAGEAARGTLVERLKASDARIDAVKADEEKTRAEITKLREEEDKATAAAGGAPASESGAAAVSKLIAERESCRAASNEAYEAIKALRAEFKLQNDLWWESEREARKVRAAERKAKQAAFEAERAERDAERRAARAELAGEPFEREVMACEQLASYLAALTAPSPAAAAAAAAAALVASNASSAPPPPPGFKPVEIRKGTRSPVADDDLLALAGSAKQRGKGARAKAAKAAAAASAAEDASSPSRVLTHSLEILSAFGSLGVALPLTAADVAATLAKLKDKKGAFLAKRERVKANGGVDPDAPADVKKEKRSEKKEKKEKVGDADADAPSSPAKAGKGGDGDANESPAVGSPASDDAGVSVSVSVGGNGSDVAVKLTVPSDSAAAAAAASAAPSK